MSQKSRRTFTNEQKAEAVRIVQPSGNPVSQVARAMGLTESALRKWVKQAQIDVSGEGQGQLTSAERQELNPLRRDLKRVQMEHDVLKKVAPFCCARASLYAQDGSSDMSSSMRSR